MCGLILIVQGVILIGRIMAEAGRQAAHSAEAAHLVVAVLVADCLLFAHIMPICFSTDRE